MKAAQITQYGGPEVIKINDIPQPPLSEGHLLVEVHAAGVNPVDWKIREGHMKAMADIPLPATSGGDFAGVVSEVGAGVVGLAQGDEVYGSALSLGAGTGSFAEFTLVTPKTIAKKPKNIDFKSAAALPLVGVSAIQALTEHIKLAGGQKILIHGGAGGIGCVAIQIAKHLGAYVAVTVGTDDVQFAKERGADEVIDYKKQNFGEIIKDFDAVFDTVGGETYQTSFGVLKKGGIIVSMVEQPNKALMEQYGVTAIAQFTQITTERLEKLTELVESDVVKIHIEKEFSLDQAAEALTYQNTGHPKGKLVITIK